MSKLPEPIWISLQDSLDLVVSLTGVAPEDAKRALVEVFMENKIRTRGFTRFDSGSEVNDLSKLTLGRNFDGLPGEYWFDAFVSWRTDTMDIFLDGGDGNVGVLALGRVQVYREELMRWVETADSASQHDGNKITAKDKGGRNPMHDWVAFQREIVRIANTPEGLPHQRELVKKMSDWCGEKWKNCPEERTIRRKVKEITDGVIPPK